MVSSKSKIKTKQKNSGHDLLTKATLLFGVIVLLLIAFKMYMGLDLGFLKTEFVNLDYSGFGNLPGSDFDPEFSDVYTNTIPFFDELVNSIYQTGRVVFEGIAILFIVYFGIRIMLAGGNDDEISKNATGLIDAIVGFLVLNSIDIIVGVFDPLEVGTDIINVPYYDLVLRFAIDFIQYSAGIVAFVMFFISAYQIFLPGAKSQEAFQASLNRIGFGVLGLFVVMTAEAAQYAIVGDRKNLLGGLLGPSSTKPQFNENLIVDVINLIEKIIRVGLYFYMPVAVLMIVYAGAQLVFKGYDDKTWESSKNIIKYVFISIVVLLSSYTLVAEILKFAI